MRNLDRKLFLQNCFVPFFFTLFNFSFLFTAPKFSFARESYTFDRIKIKEKARNNKSSQQQNKKDILIYQKENISQPKNEVLKLHQLPKKGKILGFGGEYITYHKIERNFLESVGSIQNNNTKIRYNDEFSNEFFNNGFRSTRINNSSPLTNSRSLPNNFSWQDGLDRNHIFLEKKISLSINQKTSLSKINQIRSGFSELFLGTIFFIILSCIQLEKTTFKQIDSDQSSLKKKSLKIRVFEKIKNFFKKGIDITSKNIESYYWQYLCLLAICIFIYLNKNYLKNNLVSSYNFISNYFHVNGIISDRTIRRSRWLEKNIEVVSPKEDFVDKMDKIISEPESTLLISEKEVDVIISQPTELVKTLQDINIAHLQDGATEIEVAEIKEFINSNILEDTNIIEPVEIYSKNLDQQIQQKQKELINAAIEVMEIERNEINEGREKIYSDFQKYKEKVGVLTEFETEYENYLNEQKIKSKKMNREFQERIERIRSKTKSSPTSISRRKAAREKVRRENEIKRKKNLNN